MAYRKTRALPVIILASTFLLATACSSTTSDAPSNSPAATDGKVATTNAPKADPMGKYDPPIDVTAIRNVDPSFDDGLGGTVENNIWTKLFQDQMGINLKYAWTAQTGDQFTQKLNLSIASGDLPELIPVDAIVLKKLVESDQIMDLTEVFNKYASPLTKEIMNQDGGTGFKSATFNKKLMAIPNTGSAMDGTPLLFVRTDWLKKMNLAEPKTMDDVMNIAKAFATQDPDGNGKADTVGMAVDKNLWGGFGTLEGFFNGFHSYPTIWVKDASGKLVYGGIQPETKTALGKLQEMYKNGVIDQEFGVKDFGKISESAASGKLGLYFGAMWTPGYPLQDAKNNDPSMQWQAYPVPSIDSQPAHVQAAFPVYQYFVAKKDAKHPEALVKMINLFIEKMWGKTAEPVKYGNGESGKSVFKDTPFQAWPARKNLDAHLRVVKAFKDKDTSALNPEEKDYYNKIASFQGGDNKNWSTERIFGDNGSFTVINKYVEDKLINEQQYYGAPTETMTAKATSLDKLILTTFTKIIMGATPVDEFDNFVKQWKSLGGDKMTEEVNAWAKAQ